MAAEASLERVALERAPAPERTPEMRGEPLPELRFQLEVSNDGDQPVYLQSRLRTIDFDADTGELTLNFGEPEPQPEAPLYRFFPEMTHVLPGETESLRVAIPDRITRLAPGGIETVDLSDVQRVRAVLAYGDTPFHPRPDEEQAEQAERLRAWSRTQTRAMPVAEARGPRDPRKDN